MYNLTTAMSSNRTNVTKRACDGCKIRKIRCGGGHPCKACTNARIKCTYIRVQQPRGPQKLRSTTKYLIEQAQREDICESPRQSVEPNTLAHVEQSTDRSRIPLNVLTTPLYIYHVRMYPVWPIVNVERLVSILQHDTNNADPEIHALATAVAAATVAQLRLGQGSLSDESMTADTFAAECLRVRGMSQYKSKINLNNVRISFFLHVYYENQQSGGSESLLYLREAISLAQMMNLHRESSYANLSLEEQQIRRRVLWLLFVTERGVCILHKLPVVLRTNVVPPSADDGNDPHVLPAFLKLLNLFRLFERSKMFDIIEGEDLETESVGDKLDFDNRFLETLQDKLEDGSVVFDHISDVQKADLCVTRHWMRMILWKLSTKKSISYNRSPQTPTSPSFPVAVAKEMLNIVSQLPRPAIEAHGLGMELKLYEIANSLADSIMKLAMLPRDSELEFESRPNNILYRLHSILSTFRGGGNRTLVDMLYKKMAEADSRSASTLSALQPSHAGHPRKSRQLTRVGVDQHSQDAATVADGCTSFDQDLTVTEQLPEQRTRTGTVRDGLNHPQDELYIEPMEINHHDDHQQATVDGTFPGMSLSPLFPNYIDQDPYIAPMPSLHAAAATDLPALAPSWPSYNSVELMLDDFLEQVPGDPFLQDGLLEGPFMGSDLPEQVFAGRDFVGISPV